MSDPAAGAPLDFWSTYGPALITAGAILISAASAAFAARIALVHQRDIARRRATLDLILRSEGEEFQGHQDGFIEAWKSPGLVAFAKEVKSMIPEEIKQLNHIRTVLNHYELLALGFEHNILDKDLYEKWMKAALVRTWDESREYIRETRKLSSYNKNNFRHFEELAVGWGGKAIQDP